MVTQTRNKVRGIFYFAQDSCCSAWENISFMAHMWFSLLYIYKPFKSAMMIRFQVERGVNGASTNGPLLRKKNCEFIHYNYATMLQLKGCEPAWGARWIKIKGNEFSSYSKNIMMPIYNILANVTTLVFDVTLTWLKQRLVHSILYYFCWPACFWYTLHTRVKQNVASDRRLEKRSHLVSHCNSE